MKKSRDNKNPLLTFQKKSYVNLRGEGLQGFPLLALSKNPI